MNTIIIILIIAYRTIPYHTIITPLSSSSWCCIILILMTIPMMTEHPAHFLQPPGPAPGVPRDVYGHTKMSLTRSGRQVQAHPSPPLYIRPNPTHWHLYYTPFLCMLPTLWIFSSPLFVFTPSLSLPPISHMWHLYRHRFYRFCCCCRSHHMLVCGDSVVVTSDDIAFVLNVTRGIEEGRLGAHNAPSLG